MCGMLPIAALIGLTQVGTRAAADPLLACTTDLRAASVQPTNSPVLLTIRIANGRDAAIPFRIASGSAYPQASLFMAKIINVKGQIQETSIFNDQDIPGS